MELNEYQSQAMSTCMDSCDNVVYSLTGLTAEVGEINDKIAKWTRKGYIYIEDNELIWRGYVSREERNQMMDSLRKEIGDVLWFVAHLATQTGDTLESIARDNLDKLADRKQRNKIDGNGDYR